MSARLALYSKANLTFVALLSLAFLALASGFDYVSIATALLAAVSTALIFFILVWIVVAISSFFGKVAFFIAGTLFTLLELLLICDFFIYRLYYKHVDSEVLDIALNPEAMKSIDLGVYPYLLFGIIAFLFVSFQIVLPYALPREKEAKKINKKINVFLIPIAFFIIVADKMIFGFADLFAYADIMEKNEVIPYYQKLTFARFANEYFGVLPAPKPIALGNAKSASPLDYPKNPLTYSANYDAENILILMMDAVRWDMIDEDTAPNMYELKKESIVFNDHYSGGNATRYGVFSLFYGLNAPYWSAFLNRQTHTVLFDALEYRGFDSRVFASSDLNWPEFRRTAFSSINDKVYDDFGGEPWESDRDMNEKVLEWLDQNLSEPFFAFVFYDAPHQFSYPETHRKFTEDDEGDKNYLNVDASKRNSLFNQYKNAIYYDDFLIAQVIEKLKANGSFDRTKIIICADHGEEFYESGAFGHNNSFSREQIKPLFFMRLPREKPRQIDYMTSHADFMPTIMRFLGVENPSEDYANGDDLFYAKKPREYAVIGNWNNNAIVENNLTMVFSARPNPITGTKVFDTITYKELPSSQASERAQTVLRVMNENRRFYK